MPTATKTKNEQSQADYSRLAIDRIKPNPYQPVSRLEATPETAEKFGRSIEEHGLLQTPVARQVNGNYEMADGWLRLQGFKWLVDKGLKQYGEIPVQVRDLSARQMADMVMEANTIRQDLNPIELANLYKKYIEDFKIPQAELARAHHCSQGEISNTMRLLELPLDIQARIISQEISETHGRQFLRLNYNPDLQKKVAEETVKEGYSVNQLSNEVASRIYRESENLDPEDYPTPEFDLAACLKCEHRQKVGSPYSDNKKTWRCLNKKCFEEKEDQCDKDRVAKALAELAAAKEAAGDKSKDKVLDLSKLTWRDCQEFDNYSGSKIDQTECKACPKRSLGRQYGDRVIKVCLDTKCFKAKEVEAQAKEAARLREEERKLTERVQNACRGVDPYKAQNLLGEYLLGHSRKDTREKVFRYFSMPAIAPEQVTPSIAAALILTLERYEGEKGRFNKMLATLEGDTKEFDAKVAAFRMKICKNCKHDDDKNICSEVLKNLYSTYSHGCYRFAKKDKEGGE